MVKLYTKFGDKGKTNLYDGSVVSKNDEIINFIGNLDELNSEIGLLYSYLINSINSKNIFELNNEILPVLKDIQVHLFDIGSEIGSKGKSFTFDINKRFVGNIERLIDMMTSKVPELKNFILPCGGNVVSISQCHKVRTVVRRCERSFFSSEDEDKRNEYIGIYLNRLSDYFFALVRYLHVLYEVEEVKYNF